MKLSHKAHMMALAGALLMPNASASAFDDAVDMFSDVEQRLSKQMNALGQRVSQQMSLFEQKVETKRTPEMTTLLVKLPGFNKNDTVDVKVIRETRTIQITASKKAEKKETKNEKGKEMVTQASSYQEFSYQYPLRTDESEKISATLKDGMLTITIPRVKEEKKSMSIPISFTE